MKSEKKSFVFYQDWGNYIMGLDDAEALDLARAIISQGLGLEYNIQDKSVRTYFEMVIRPDMVANEQKKAEFRKRQAEYGAKGGKAKADKSTESKGSLGEPRVAKGSLGFVANNGDGDGNGIDISKDISIGGLFKSPKVAEAMERFISVRPKPFPPASISQTLHDAAEKEKVLGEAKCIEAIEKAIRGSYKAIVWPTATEKKPNSFTSMQNNEYDFDELERRLLG